MDVSLILLGHGGQGFGEVIHILGYFPGLDKAFPHGFLDLLVAEHIAEGIYHHFQLVQDPSGRIHQFVDAPCLLAGNGLSSFEYQARSDFGRRNGDEFGPHDPVHADGKLGIAGNLLFFIHFHDHFHLGSVHDDVIHLPHWDPGKPDFIAHLQAVYIVEHHIQLIGAPGKAEHPQEGQHQGQDDNAAQGDCTDFDFICFHHFTPCPPKYHCAGTPAPGVPGYVWLLPPSRRKRYGHG